MSNNLDKIVLDVSKALRPFVSTLAAEKSYVGTAVFFKDNWHFDSAGMLTMIYAPERNRKQLEFSKQSIESHRVQLNSTTVGDTFASGESDQTVKVSRMNPHHRVWGAYMKLCEATEIVVQSAFDVRFGTPPPYTMLINNWRMVDDKVFNAALPLINIESVSLADTLQLDVPVTPNAYVIKWDITHSTKHVQKSYTSFRSFTNNYQSATKLLTEASGGLVANFTGDGQNIVVPLPPDVDPNNPSSVQAFHKRVVKPFVDKLARSSIGMPERMPLRFAIGLGYVETSHQGEATGPIFWRLSSLLKRTGHPTKTVITYDSSVSGKKSLLDRYL